MSDVVKTFFGFLIGIVLMEFLFSYCYSLYLGTAYNIRPRQIIIYLIMGIVFSFWKGRKAIKEK